MALSPQSNPSPSHDEAFVADRAMFWSRFTGFTKWSIIGLVVLLILLWIFLV